MNGLIAAGQGLQAWSLGLTVTMVFLDMGPGFSRDHPSFSRRLTGAAVGPLAAISMGLLLPDCTLWKLLMTCGPFTLLSIWYSWTWWFRWPADQRRVVGKQAAIMGVISLFLVMLTWGPENWNSGVVIAAYTASAGLLGGLTVLALMAWTKGQDEISEPAQTQEVPLQAAAVGLGVTGLASVEVLPVLLRGATSMAAELELWLGLSLVLPVLLLFVGRRALAKFPRFLWSAALGSAVLGQATIHTLLLHAPGLIPYVPLE